MVLEPTLPGITAADDDRGWTGGRCEGCWPLVGARSPCEVGYCMTGEPVERANTVHVRA